MKKLLMITNLFFTVAMGIHLSSAQAQSSVEVSSKATNGGENTSVPGDLQSAFQKEFVYLASQKQALLNIQKETEKTLKNQARDLKTTALSLQAEVVGLSSKNDEQHEYLLSLEKRKKELEKKGSSLENSYKKSQAMIRELQAGLKFELAKEKEATVLVPEDLKISTFEDSYNKANELLTASARTESFEGSFFDMNGKLVEGSITRFGRSSAIGSVGESHYTLAPNGNGLLKALAMAETPKGPFAHLFIFDNLAKEGKMKHQARFIEKLADFSPLLFLGMILLLVGGLFLALIKV